MLASEIMTARPVTGTPDTTIQQATTTLRRGRFRHLPIVHQGRLIGVVSDRDLQRTVAAGASPEGTVAALIRGPAITATPDTPVEHVAMLLQENKIGCVPVIAITPGAAGQLVGIITESDVFRAFVRAFGVLEPGSRLIIHLRDVPDDLALVARVLQRHRVPVLTLATHPFPQVPGVRPAHPPATLRLMLCLSTIDPRLVVAALRQAGMTVEAVGVKAHPAPDASTNPAIAQIEVAQ